MRAAPYVGLVLNTVIFVVWIALLVWLWEGSLLAWLLNVVIFSIPFSIISMLLRFGVIAVVLAIIGKKDP